jgi:DivIVA domain-containing protein
MSATGLDLPVLMSDEHIRRREFVVGRRGYDTAQVREFLEHVADQVRQLEAMLQEARRQGQAASRAATKAPVDPYGELADRVAGVLRAADQDAEGMRREAKKDAERILSEARADAERILSEARADAERILADAEAAAAELRSQAEAEVEELRSQAQTALREARERANRTIDGLSTKREELVSQLAAMQGRLEAVARDLGSAIAIPDDLTAPEGVAEPPPGPSVWSAGGRAEGDDLPATQEGLGSEAGTGEPSDAGEAAPTGEAEATGEPSDAVETAAEEVLAEEPIVLHEAEGGDGEVEDDHGEPEGDLDDEAQMAILDQAFEGLWEGSDPQLELPDMPPLDLDWGDLEEDDDR